jgi:formylglycine-generating enzyme required for sulfatase activity
MGGEVGDAPARPRVDVSWDDAQAFLAALRARDTSLAFQLPSEAPWEYACRAGMETSTYGGEFRSQEEAKRVLESIAWWVGNAGKHAMPVATKTANRWGLYDMLGNVWEWCEDAWVAGGAPRLDAQGPLPAAVGTLRVLRGGSWSYDARHVRAAHRSADPPGRRFPFYGFRLSRAQ